MGIGLVSTVNDCLIKYLTYRSIYLLTQDTALVDIWQNSVHYSGHFHLVVAYGGDYGF